MIKSTETNRILISKAQIIDGSGSKPFLGNVILKGDRIEKVDKDSLSSFKDKDFDSIIDASGTVSYTHLTLPTICSV